MAIKTIDFINILPIILGKETTRLHLVFLSLEKGEIRLIMILERTNNEILVRLPAYVDLTELQNMLDYLEYKETTSNTKAKQKDVDELSESVNKSIWNKFKAQRKLK